MNLPEIEYDPRVEEERAESQSADNQCIAIVRAIESARPVQMTL